MTETLTLAAFLTARLDEADAYEIHRRDCSDLPEIQFYGWGPGRPLGFVAPTPKGEGTVRMCECGQPARVLADVEAKRRIVALDVCLACNVEMQPCDHQDETLRLLALPYAGHEGYREEWRP